MRPGHEMIPGNPGRTFSRSTIFPILSNPGRLWRKGYVLPGILTVVATIGLLGASDFHTFFVALAYYVTFLQCLLVYLMCGRRHLWWMMLAVFALSYGLMFSPLFWILAAPFHAFLGLANSNDYVVSFVGYFFAAGLLEEIYKALPVLALAAVAIYRRRTPGAPAAANWLGVSEPLDGIALAVAAAAAFAVVETLAQYVPDLMHTYFGALAKDFQKTAAGITVPNNETAKAVAAAIDRLMTEAAKGQGLQLLISRLFSQIAGHLAYSGYFGYFIGLAVLRPKSAPQLLLIGLATSATLHAAWDAFASVPAMSVAIGTLSYAFLMAAILKARQISPSRADNFASIGLPLAGSGPLDPPPVAAPAPQWAMPAAPAAPATPSPAVVVSRTLILKLADVRRPLAAGLQIQPQFLGSAGAGRGRGPIAEVQSHDKGIVLRNTAAQAWQVRSPTGQVHPVESGKAVRLEPGLEIDFGGIKGIVEAG
jgi:RsiW-degrading membrane proteinase PrsW (M82 family)